MEQKEKSTTTGTSNGECIMCGGKGWWGLPPVKCVSCGGTGPVPENSATTEAPATIRYFTTTQAARELLQLIAEDRARAWVTARLFPEGPRCPECGLIVDNDKTYREGGRCECGRCGKYFTARTGTFLNGAHFDDRQVVLMAALIDHMVNGLTPARIAEIIGVSADTVRLWMKRFDAFGK